MKDRIIKRGNRYSIVLSMELGPDGKRKQQWISVKGNKKAAQDKLIELEHSYRTGSYVKPSKLTTGEYLERWLEEYAKPALSPRSYERYVGIVRQYFIREFGNVPLTELRPEHIQRHYADMLNKGLAPRSVRFQHAVCHRALRSALKWELVSRNVADGVELPQADHKDMQTWDIDEVTRFLEVAKGSQYYPLFYCALYTGCRRSELLGLRWKDADFIYGQLSINRGLHHLKDGSYIFSEPKSKGSKRTIATPPSLAMVLREHRKIQELECHVTDDSLVFCHADGKPYRPNSITRAWTILATRAGVKTIRLHDSRHTHATLLLKQGVHPKIVQERLGHSTIAMTLDTYSHVVPGLQQAAALSFDKMLNGDTVTETVLQTSL